MRQEREVQPRLFAELLTDMNLLWDCLSDEEGSGRFF